MFLGLFNQLRRGANLVQKLSPSSFKENSGWPGLNNENSVEFETVNNEK
jgi:hypothetical protein